MKSYEEKQRVRTSNSPQKKVKYRHTVLQAFRYEAGYTLSASDLGNLGVKIEYNQRSGTACTGKTPDRARPTRHEPVQPTAPPKAWPLERSRSRGNNRAPLRLRGGNRRLAEDDRLLAHQPEGALAERAGAGHRGHVGRAEVRAGQGDQDDREELIRSASAWPAETPTQINAALVALGHLV